MHPHINDSIKMLALIHSVAYISTKPVISEVGFQNFTVQPGQWIADSTCPTANPLAMGHRTSVNFDPWVQDIASATNKIRCLDPSLLAKDADRVVELNWLFNVTINDISVIYVTARGSRYRILIKLAGQPHYNTSMLNLALVTYL